jgi:hypothetical protein
MYPMHNQWICIYRKKYLLHNMDSNQLMWCVPLEHILETYYSITIALHVEALGN